MIALIAAQPEDAKQLTELALQSKAYWGYSKAFMQDCVNELSVDPQSILSVECHTVKAVEGTDIVGFYQLTFKPQGLELEALFVTPLAIGRGIGTQLIQDAMGLAKSRRVQSISIQSDPNAVAFYIAMGATQIGEVRSQSIRGRSLPLLALQVY